MADFGTYTTPDGRSLRLPPAFAAQFVGLTPAPQPGPPELPAPTAIPTAPPGQSALPIPGGEPAWTPDNSAALAAATPPPPMPTDGPVTSPDQMPPGTGQSVVPRGPVTSPAEDTGVSSLAKPPAPGAAPMTERDLAKLGNAGVYNAQAAAIEEQKAAARKVGEAAADQATMVGNAMADAAAEERRILEQRQKVAEQNARDLQAKTDEYLRNAKAIADTRIDREIDHPVMTAIGLALSTIGSAMRGQSNEAAIKGVYDALDRKVAAQMQDLELKQKGLGVQREAIGFQQQAGKDRLEQLDTYRIAAIAQAQRKIEAIKTQTSVPGVRAAADQVLAALEGKKADVLGGAQERYQQQRNAELNRAQAERFHKDTMAFQEKQLDEQRNARAAALAEKLIDRKDAAGAARVKALSEQAIVDPATGDLMLTPAGQQKMQQADAYEAKARKATDPEQAQRLNTAAQQLRESAQANDFAVALNKKGAEEAQKAISTTQEMINKTDIARRALQADPSPANREAWASLQTQFQFLKAQAAKGLGERVSVRAMEALDDVLSIDADSLWSRAADKGKAIKALDTLDNEFSQAADVALKSAGIKSGWQPRKAPNEFKFGGKTAAEIREGAMPASALKPIPDGEISKDINPEVIQAARFAAQAGTLGGQKPDDAYERALGRKSAKGNASNYGLDPDQDEQVQAMIKRAQSAGNAEYGRIVDSLSAPLTQDRPGLAIGIGKLIRDEDPKLFDAILANIANKPGGGKMKAEELDRITAPPTGIKPASSGGLTPDAAAALDAAKDRVRRGLPPVPTSEFLPPMRNAGPDPQLPAFLQGRSPAERAKLLEWARANGFADAVAGVQ